jgi:hypothetical protein
MLPQQLKQSCCVLKKESMKIGFMDSFCFAKQFSIVIGTNGTGRSNDDKLFL